MNNSKSKFVTLFLLLIILSVFSACRYDMQDQPRYKAYKESDFFNDKKGSRPNVDGTVARGMLNEDKALMTGKKEGEVAAPTEANPYPDKITEFPFPITKEVLDRGQDRYKIFCSACHGPLGTGDGMIARRGFEGVKSYHTDQLRNAPVGHFYDVITNGFGKMNSYSAQITDPKDRWAIVAYVRALQISQHPNPMTGTAKPSTSANTANVAANTATNTVTTNSNTTNSNAAKTNANAKTEQPKTDGGNK